MPTALSVLPLRDGWTVVPLNPRHLHADVLAAWLVPATVPGLVHADLLAAGLTEEAFGRTHALRTANELLGWA